MTLEMGLWRADSTGLRRLDSGGIQNEAELESYIESDPELLGQTLLIVGRQVRTPHGGIIDILALDSDGAVHTIELKRDKTPRDVVAQALDYTSWVVTLGREDIIRVFEDYRPGVVFDTAFVEAFGGDAPDELNAAQAITIVAASLDPATERIVTFLHDMYDLPINVVFFRHFTDGGASYLARTWLIAQDVGKLASQPKSASRTRETWNGRDWYAAFGQELGRRSWEDARKYGFLSAGGGDWYSRSLKTVPVGARVFACIPKTGYVGVGIVTRAAVPFEEALVGPIDAGAPLTSLVLAAGYEHPPVDGQDHREYVISVDWIHAVPEGDAVWKTGMFANQNSACRLRHGFTLEQVSLAFGLDDES